MYRQPSDEEPMHAADVCSAKQRARCEPDVSPPTASARSGGVWGPALVFNVQLACFYAGVVCTLSQWVIFLSFFLFRIYCLVHVSFCFLCSLVLYRFDCVVCYGYILPQAPVLLLCNLLLNKSICKSKFIIWCQVGSGWPHHSHGKKFQKTSWKKRATGVKRPACGCQQAKSKQKAQLSTFNVPPW